MSSRENTFTTEEATDSTMKQQQQQNSSSAPPPQEDDDDDDDEDEWLVSCRCESAKAISTLLSCLQHVAIGAAISGESTAKEMSSLTQSSRRRKTSASSSSTTRHSIQPVTVFCSPTSLTFHVYGKAKQTQASVDMQVGLFSEYRVAQTENTNTNNDGTNNGAATTAQQEDWQAGGEFCVNLTTVLECLHVLGTQTLDKQKVCFSYNLTKELFKMELLQQESGVLSTAAIPGILPPEDDLGNSLALAFRSSPIAARIIVKSETLKEVVHELELVSGATCGTVALGPEAGLEMAAVGHLGECLISIPAKGSHVVSLEVPAAAAAQQQSATTTTIPRTYPLHSLLGSMRGLDIAQETCITVNNNGMMAIQHQVLDQQVGDGTPSFIDFIMCCLEEDDDNDDDEEEDEESRNPSQTSPRSMAWSHSSQQGTSPASQAVVSEVDPSSRYLDSEDENEDDESRNIMSSSSSAVPLFGTVVGELSTTSSPDGLSSRSTRRRTRRPVSSNSRRRRFLDDEAQEADAGDEDSERSVSLFDASDEDETEPLDITAAASPAPRRDREECSSPELVYGRQH